MSESPMRLRSSSISRIAGLRPTETSPVPTGAGASPPPPPHAPAPPPKTGRQTSESRADGGHRRAGFGKERVKVRLGWPDRLTNAVDRLVGFLRESRERILALRESKAIGEFREMLEIANDRATIEAALVRVVGRLTKAAFVELLLDPGQHTGELSTKRLTGWPRAALGWTNAEIDALGYPLSLGLWCGENRRLALQVYEAPAERWKRRLTARLVRRLSDLCAEAAAAERALPPIIEPPSVCRSSELPAKPANNLGLPTVFETRRSSQRDPQERFIPFPDPNRSSITKMVHDATYLNAVLPFALAQAGRHQEPLTVLCLESERPIPGIPNVPGETLGMTMRKIAESIARSLRASDVVVHLEDDRIVVVLPDTSTQQAEHVVQIARSIISNVDPTNADSRPQAIHVGLASFPIDAQDMPDLLEAADEAVEQLKRPSKSTTQRRRHQRHDHHSSY